MKKVLSIMLVIFALMSTLASCFNIYDDNSSMPTTTTTKKTTTTKTTTTTKKNEQVETENHHIHNYVSEYVSSTCTKDGYDINTCSGCRDSYRDNFSVAWGHSFGQWNTVNEPTENEKKVVQRICSSCSEAETFTVDDGLAYSLNKDGESYTVINMDLDRQEVVIPSEYNGLPVTRIGENAFADCQKLTDVIIPDTVTYIGMSAFARCQSLASITIPDSVKSIDSHAFAICKSLANIVLPDSLTSIGSYVFDRCESLTSITIPDSVVSIGHFAFNCCDGLSDVNLSTSLTSLGEGAFWGCGAIKNILIPNSLMTIPQNAFAGCSIESIVIHSSVTRISIFAFQLCSRLSNIEVAEDNKYYMSKDGILYSKDGAELVVYPSGKKDSSFEIPNGVKYIAEYAFDKCKLTSITIPKTAKNIGERAFNKCTSLGQIVYNGTKDDWDYIRLGRNWNDGVPANVVICSDGEEYLR